MGGPASITFLVDEPIGRQRLGRLASPRWSLGKKMKKLIAAAFAVTVAMPVVSAAWADEPDGLILPPGFHATVVADGLGSIRHLAVRGNGDIFVSTRHAANQPSNGIIALRLGPDHKAVQTTHFSEVDQGTGIRFHLG